ncbi:MAG: hypothetical protein HRT52_06290 [Colwellia sp.]|nr:hypothetical protein [Colwellia sp.]
MQVQNSAWGREQGATQRQWLFPCRVLQRSTRFLAELPLGKAINNILPRY